MTNKEQLLLDCDCLIVAINDTINDMVKNELINDVELEYQLNSLYSRINNELESRRDTAKTE